MFKNFVDWLDGYIQGEDSSAIAKAAVGLLAFAGLLGTVLGSPAVRAGGFVVVALVVLSLGLVLLADRRRLRSESDKHRNLLQKYCDIIYEADGPVIRVKLWKQETFIDEEGNVRETLTVNAVALREKVYFVRLRMGADWEQPKRQRRKVRVHVRRLTTEHGRGTKWNATEFWMPDGRLHFLAHLYSPLELGEEVSFEMERIWPRKCYPLMKRGESEPFKFRFTKSMPIDYIDYRVVLPRGVEVFCEPIDSAPGDVVRVVREEFAGGYPSFRLVIERLEPHRWTGFRLELK